MPSVEEIEEAQRVTWAKCSPGWDKWDQVIGDQLGPVGAAIIDSLDIAENQLHLDIAGQHGRAGAEHRPVSLPRVESC